MASHENRRKKENVTYKIRNRTHTLFPMDSTNIYNVDTLGHPSYQLFHMKNEHFHAASSLEQQSEEGL